MSNTTYPNLYLVAPAKHITEQQTAFFLHSCKNLGIKVKTCPNLYHQNAAFAGDDELRLLNFQLALNDTETQAIICARGGYGSTKIIDALDFSVFVEKQKSIIGFSDITAFHLHVYKLYNMKGLHAPMPLNLNVSMGKEPVKRVMKSIKSKQTEILASTSVFNRNGHAEGILLGGNLSVICHLIGTESMPNFKNKILMIEEVGEPFYKIDRMMLQLKRAGVLEHLKGLVFGDFSDCLDLGNWFGNSLENFLLQHVKDYHYPVCFNVPIGHCDSNIPIWIGAETKLTVNDNVVEIIQ